MSYTYALLLVSAAAYEEIRAKLWEAGYTHAFHGEGVFECLDMHGIALQVETQRDETATKEATP